MDPEIDNFDAIELVNLPDDELLKICKSRFITKPADFNLKLGPKNSEGYLKPVPGGLYDGRIFGSIYENRCNCGAVTTPNLPCIECGTELFDNIQRKIRYAIIDANVLFTTPAKLKKLVTLLRKNFTIKLDITSEILHKLNDFSWNKERDVISLLYLCQLSYDKKSNSLIFSDTLTDKSYISLEGLQKIITENKPNLLPEFKQCVNRYIPVTPAIFRKVKFYVIKGRKKIQLPKSTAYYRSIIIAVDTYKSIMNDDDLYKVASFAANLRSYVSKILMRFSGFMKSSKETIARAEYKINSAHSGRAVISGDPELPIDTIKIPRILAYEMYKKQFLKYLMEIHGYKGKELINLYNNPTEEINKIFDQFCKNKVVIINRPPSIHAQNIQCYKLALSEDYGIHFPLLTTQAQNADFDGDAVMFFAVPDEYRDYMYERCNPSNYTVYPTDGQPILKARHEILYGLTLATKLIEGNEIKEFLCFEDLQEAVDNDELWVNEVVNLNGKTTTYGREKLSKIFKVDDISNIIGYNPINAKNIVDIYLVINSHTPNERVQILHNMQEFALEVVTLEGATSISVKDIYYEVPDELKKRINEIMDSEMPEKDKIREIELLHSEMISDMMQHGLSEEVVNRIKEGNRGKMDAIQAMVIPSFSVDAQGQLHMAENSLVEGLTEQEYLEHSAANRELLITKANMTPFSGFFNRQLKEAGKRVVMIKGKVDDKNRGLSIPSEYAKGRMTLDGKIITSSDKGRYVTVRSCVTTDLNYVTIDMFDKSDKFTYDYDGRCNIGIDWMTSFASDVTQASLSLKHGGRNRFVPDEYKFIAPYDTEVEFTDDLIILKAKNESYIKPTKWSTRGNGFYKKGELIGEVPHYVTVTIQVESLVKLLKAQGSLKYPDMSNDIRIADCYNRSTPNVLKYSNGKVTVGKISWSRDSRFIPYPIGTTLEPYQRICPGLQNMNLLDNSSLNTRFNIFFKQLNELRPVRIEIAEMIFKVLTNGGGKYYGLTVINTSKNDSALSSIGYGYSRKAVNRIVEGELKVNTKDPMTEIILTPFMYKLLEALYK